MFMGDFPMMTDRARSSSTAPSGSWSASWSARPGVIFQPGRDLKTIFTGTIHPYRGEWIELDIEAKPSKDVTAGARVARKRRLSLFVLLRALGYGDEAFLERFVRHFTSSKASGRRRKTSPRPVRRPSSRSTSGPVPASPVGRGRPPVLRERLLQPQALRPDPGRPLQAEPQARAGDRADLRTCSASTSSVRLPVRAYSALRRSWRRPPTCCTWPCTWRTGSPPTASTTRTTSPTAVSVRSAS